MVCPSPNLQRMLMASEMDYNDSRWYHHIANHNISSRKTIRSCGISFSQKPRDNYQMENPM